MLLVLYLCIGMIDASLARSNESIDKANAMEQVFPILKDYISVTDGTRSMILALADFDPAVRRDVDYLMADHFMSLDDLIFDFLLITDLALSPVGFRSMYTLSPLHMPVYTYLRESFMGYAENMRKCLYASLPLGLRLRYGSRFQPVNSNGHPGGPILVNSRRGCQVEYVHRSEALPDMRVQVMWLQNPSVFLEVVGREAIIWIGNQRDGVSLGGAIIKAVLSGSSRSDIFYLHVTRLLPNMEGLDYVYVYPDLETEKLVGNMLVVHDDHAIDIMGDMISTPLI